MAAPTFPTRYCPNPERYDGRMEYRKCGNSGIQLPAFSLGFWWNFGGIDPMESSRERILYAFDQGITCFDLANNYGPPFGSAEETFGRVFRDNLRPHRHEIIVTTKAGNNMWEGPYGRGSSRKMLMTSIDESLQRMNLDYVDIFYSHRYDEHTPLDETMQALADIARQGKALYIGLSNYPVDKLLYAVKYLQDSNIHCLIYQGKYNLLYRNVETNMLDTLNAQGIGFTAFCPIAQGILTDKYLNGIPADSRVGKGHYLKPADVAPEVLQKSGRAQSHGTATRTNASSNGHSLAFGKPIGHVGHHRPTHDRSAERQHRGTPQHGIHAGRTRRNQPNFATIHR